MSKPAGPAPRSGFGPLVLVGPTASGKSQLALDLATRFAGTEIVSADAMAVYRGMDIGTAKPSVAERERVRHHLVDVVDADEDYTVARFRDEVAAVLAEVEARDEGRRPPIVVGGTGLYVQAVVDDFNMPPQYPAIRAELEANLDTESMYQRLVDLDPAAAAKMLPSNRRRIVRALEVCVGSGQRFSSFGPGVDHYGPTRFRLAGLEIERDVMDERIERRYHRQIAEGFLEEVAGLLEEPGFSRTAGQALGYRELANHLAGQYSLEEALDEAVRRTRKFARRQQRWFRRDPRITWFPADADDLVERVADWWATEPGAPSAGADERGNQAGSESRVSPS